MELFCSKCHQTKNIACFNKDISKKNGVKMPCKTCRSEYNKENYAKLIAQSKPQIERLLCYTCNVYKLVKDFYPQKSSKTGYNSNCSECVLSYNKALRHKHSEQYKEHSRKNSRKRRVTHSQFLEEYKLNKPCADCGGIFPPCCVDFDHVKGKKVFNISSKNTASIAQLVDEIAKCELVCANCHRVRTKLRLYLSKTT